MNLVHIENNTDMIQVIALTALAFGLIISIVMCQEWNKNNK